MRWAFPRVTALRLSWLAAMLPQADLRTAWTATIALLDRWREEACELASSM